MKKPIKDKFVSITVFVHPRIKAQVVKKAKKYKVSESALVASVIEKYV